MADQAYFVLAIISVLLPGCLAWIAADWNKYDVRYQSDDQNNGMLWSQTYRYLLFHGYGGYRSYSGCIVDRYEIIQSCTGPSVDINSYAYLTNLTTQGYFTATVTSISIRFTPIQNISKDFFASLIHLQTVSILSCGNLENIDKDMFLHNTELQSLIIQGTKISLVPDLSRTKVSIVALMQNKIHWIPPGWINGSNLRTVSFAYNELPQFKNALGEELTNLKYLGLEYNLIRKISKSSLSPLSSAPNFVHLNLSNNAITFIEAQSFSQIPTLQILEMQHNALFEFQPDVFWNLLQVKHLDFHRNSLTSLGSKSLMNLPRLEELRIHSQNNPLQKIVHDAWSGIGQSLKYLYISENSLISFPHAVLCPESYPSLLRIHADYNQISNSTELGLESFHASELWLYEIKRQNCAPFSSYPILTHLFLNNNRLRHVYNTEFCEMESLVYLYLQNNEIIDVKLYSTASPCLPVLLELYLRNNKIETIEAEQTNRSQLRSLQYLDLGINRLQYIPDSLKRSDVFPAIRTLFLDSNILTFLVTGTFFNLSTLLWLTLDSNRIVVIENNSFPLQIQYLSLYSNNIRFRHDHPFTYLSSLTTLNLAVNSIDILPLDAFSHCYSLANLYLQNNRIPQILKVHFANCSLLNDLDLSSNEIGKMEDGTLSHLSSMAALRLPGNKLTHLPEAGTFHDKSFGTLDLSYNRIVSIPSYTFKNVGATWLYLQGNDIAYIEKEAFSSVSGTTLNIGSNKIRWLESYSFRSVSFYSFHLNNMYATELPSFVFKDISATYFYLNDGQIQNVSSNAFSGVSGHEIHLERNPICYLESYAFNTVSFHRFYMHNMYFTHIPSFSFKNVRGNYFYLNNGKIQNISTEAFSVVSGYELHLEGNPVRHLEQYSFKSVHFVNGEYENNYRGVIYLQGTLLAEIPKFAFYDVSTDYMYLNDGQLEIVNEQAFFGMHVLKDCYLQNNKISTLTAAMYGGESTIGDYLLMSYNGLKNIEGSVFGNVTVGRIDLSHNNLVIYPLALKQINPWTINLASNQITSIPYTAFDGRTSLKYLYLENNYISRIQRGLLSPLNNLDTLNLNNNGIEIIDESALENLHSLKSLFMTNNILTHIPYLGSMNGAVSINFTSNKIETMDPSAFKDIPRLVSIDLFDNFLGCQCQVVYAMMALSNSTTVRGSCHSPAKAAGVSFVTNDTNKSNYFKKVDNTVFQCTAENVTAISAGPYDVIVEWSPPKTTYAQLTNGTNNTTPFPTDSTSVFPSTTVPFSFSTTENYSFNSSFQNGSIFSATTVEPFILDLNFSVTCISKAASTLHKVLLVFNDKVDRYNLNFTKADGVQAGTTYECSIQMGFSGEVSAKSSPVFIITPDLNAIKQSSPSDLKLIITYYDFSKNHSDFDGTSGITVSSPTYIPSPYGAWLAISNSPTSDTFSDWYRSVPGTNYKIESTINLALIDNNTYRFWSDTFHPLDGEGYGSESTEDCSGVLHNFGFTSAIRAGLKFNGTERITLGGGEAVWFFINRILLIQYLGDALLTTTKCLRINLAPAAKEGGGVLLTEIGDVVNGSCSNLTPLSSSAELALDIGEVYHFDVFHAEVLPCRSTFFLEVENGDFVTGIDNSADASFSTDSPTLSTVVENGSVLPSSNISNTFSSTTATSSASTTTTTTTIAFQSTASTTQLPYLTNNTNTSAINSTKVELPLDYIVKIPEDFHVNGIVDIVYLVDAFSIGPTFEVILFQGNEGRHFTLKENTDENIAVALPPPPVNYTYTMIPETNISYIACDGPATVQPELNDISPQHFVFNSTSVLLTLATSVDRESVDRYNLALTIVDTGSSLTGTILITIKIQDINDNCPYVGEYVRNLTPTPVLRAGPIDDINTTDADKGINAEIKYFIQSTVIRPPVEFNISLDLWREIYVNTSIARFSVVAIDSGNPPRGTQIYYNVTLDNSCLVDVEYGPIDYSFRTDNKTGETFLRTPKYWVHLYDCKDFLGISSGIVRDDQLAASSSEYYTSGPEHARLNFSSDSYSNYTGGWVARSDDPDPYYQVDMKEPHKFTQIHLQGRQDAYMFVTSFNISYSDDENSGFHWYFNTLKESSFVGHTNWSSFEIVTVDLDPPILSRIIRIHPRTWVGGISLRLELSGCSQAKQHFYDTTCVRCYASYYCVGDGRMRPCGRCNTPQENSTCSRNPTEHSFGLASECTACPKGWICHDGYASICPSNHYAICSDTFCPDNCTKCESGTVCRDGIRYVCDIGTFANSSSRFCDICQPGTYQNAVGQSQCLKCPAGLDSSPRRDRCERCHDIKTYSAGDGIGCTSCISIAECPCMAGDTCFRGAGCYNLGNGAYECGTCPDGFEGDGLNCTDTDECNVHHPCWNASACINTSPGYQCLACPFGYTGTYEDALAWNITRRTFRLGNKNYATIQIQTCDDINECLLDNTVCKSGLHCINTIGSFYCGVCEPGYIWDSVKTICLPGNFCALGAWTCDKSATCVYIAPGKYRCECNAGYAGNGKLCYMDSDNDGYPNQSLPCTDWGCKRDNCVFVANSNQEDADGDQIGDECDTDDDDDYIYDELDNCRIIPNKDQNDTDNDGIGDACDNCPNTSNSFQMDTDMNGIGDVCDIDKDGDGINNIVDNCPLLSNPGQEDTGDRDGIGDACDNCVNVSNSLQEDTNENRYGDACDPVTGSFKDKDGDSILDFMDNCQDVANTDQCDTDMDGIGDLCDFDIDNDGILDDNCPLITGTQQDLNGNGIGDGCESDADEDGLMDSDDTCPYNIHLNTTSFADYFTVNLYPGLSTPSPVWSVKGNGIEVQQLNDSSIMPTILLGQQGYSEINYKGTWYVSGNESVADYIGFVFGYTSNRKFYVAIWKREHTNYAYQAGTKGIQIKLINSNTGPSASLANALWHSSDTSDQVKLLWQDPELEGWEPRKSYKWNLIHKPSLGYIRLWLYQEETLLVDSGPVYDITIKGGRVGVLQFGAFPVTWSNLRVYCLEYANRGLQLDGNDDYVNVGNIIELKMNESFTIDLWVYLQNGSKSHPVACTGDTSVCLYMNASSLTAFYGETVISTSITLEINRWYSISYRYSLGDFLIALFINGTKVADKTTRIIDWANKTEENMTLHIGKDKNNFMQGIVDKVRIFGIALSDSEILSHVKLPSLYRSALQGYANVEFEMQEDTGSYTLPNSGLLNITGELNGEPKFVQSLQDNVQFRIAYPTN
ncbi:hypothetical protein CHS0354_039999 [Potamilus streckersoni]|uniref:Chaoptin n=1 Tax=Potamilus streckersoni TaxID=2493646 RepID=A0AAE0S080_9BIVA|nr:hypothetical protein CHS0354_039999 [Potamilus streckersoni]